MDSAKSTYELVEHLASHVGLAYMYWTRHPFISSMHIDMIRTRFHDYGVGLIFLKLLLVCSNVGRIICKIKDLFVASLSLIASTNAAVWSSEIIQSHYLLRTGALL